MNGRKLVFWEKEMVQQRIKEIRALEQKTFIAAQMYANRYSGWNRYSEEGMQMSEVVDQLNREYSSETLYKTR